MLEFGGLQVDPQTLWPARDDAHALGSVSFDDVEVTARVNVRQADGVIIAGGSGKIVRFAGSTGLIGVGDGPGQHLPETTTVQIRFDARLNAGDDLDLGFAMRWHETLDAWLPDCRFFVHESGTIVPMYFF